MANTKIRRRGGACILVRRGVRFGAAVDRHPETPAPREIEARFAAASPIVLRGGCARYLGIHRAAIARTLVLFERARAGGGFRAAMAARLAGARRFTAAGVSVDTNDPREIEKFHADANDRLGARDLHAKLSWVALDPRDRSLRIRFSFGSEWLRDWQRSPRRAVASDAFAEATFPECGAITKNPPLVRLVRRLVGGPVRFSERILYSNAPGGGAVFHHDGEPRQLGVAYAQLSGETGWLALRKRDLALLLGKRLRRAPASLLRALDGHGDAALERELGRSKGLVRELVAQSHFYHVRAGDVILLPSHGPDDVAWHSVFALGRAPSLALSFGMFPLGKSRGAARGRR
jgi:hypothetical protein